MGGCKSPPFLMNDIKTQIKPFHKRWSTNDIYGSFPRAVKIEPRRFIWQTDKAVVPFINKKIDANKFWLHFENLLNTYSLNMFGVSKICVLEDIRLYRRRNDVLLCFHDLREVIQSKDDIIFSDWIFDFEEMPIKKPKEPVKEAIIIKPEWELFD